MADLKNYFEDGAKWQEQVVLMMLKGRLDEVTDNTYDKDYLYRYHADVQVGRYENCREQGYVFTLRYNFDQLAHYCVFEHRNSDNICIIKLNKPTLNDIWEGKESKYDVTKQFKYMEFEKTVDYIIDDMKAEIAKYLEEHKK